MAFEFFFPKTFYYHDELISEPENQKVLADIANIKRQCPKSTRDNLYTTYGSIANVLEREAFVTLRMAIGQQVMRYLDQTDTKPGLKPVFTDAWISISSPQNYERMHTHAGSYISGVYYLQAPKNCGDIIFENLDDNLWQSTRHKNENQNCISYQAKATRLILFNSNLPHCVGQNLSSSDRIALSFNVALQ